MIHHFSEEMHYAMAPVINKSFKADKELIKPYFDDSFYKSHCGSYQESKLAPIDHFILSGYKGDFKKACDPNPWFKVTLYKERLWPTSKNPLIEFLKQKRNRIDPKSPTIIVYMKKGEEMRAWIAIEALLRRSDCFVQLCVSNQEFSNIPVGFEPFLKRGLKVQIEKDGLSKSFYQSPFLKTPHLFVEAKKIEPLNKGDDRKPLEWISRSQHMGYIMHNLYGFTKWKRKGVINPLVLNFCEYCTEPLMYSSLGKTEKLFQQHMERLADGFDLMLIGIDLKLPNSRVIPGYLKTWVTAEDMPSSKEFSVSFLFSLGSKGISNYKTGQEKAYYSRIQLWEKKDEIKTPKSFYISSRDLQYYPSHMHKFELPGGQKKWIFKSQFSIAIENTQQVNYFTEKLLGCFWTLTVPIYIGCPNIADYFDTRGMIIVKNIDEAIQAANSLTPETYHKMLPYLKENKRRTEEFLTLEKRVKDEFFKKNGLE